MRKKIALNKIPEPITEETPGNCIMEMFYCTDKNGILYVPQWFSDYDVIKKPEKAYFMCEMEWDEDMARWLAEECNKIFSAFKEICYVLKNSKKSKDVKFSSFALDVRDRYLKGLKIVNYDSFLGADYGAKIYIKDEIDKISEKIKAGTHITKSDMKFYNEYKDITVSDYERKYYNEYLQEVESAARKNNYGRISASKERSAAIRILNLLLKNAPEKEIYKETATFAEIFAINNYCKKITPIKKVN